MASPFGRAVNPSAATSFRTRARRRPSIRNSTSTVTRRRACAETACPPAHAHRAPAHASAAAPVFLPLTVGGGVRAVEDVRRLLLAGADKVSVNTAAVQDPTLVERCARTFGSQCMVVAIDARARREGAGGWEVFTHGGRQ